MNYSEKAEIKEQIAVLDSRIARVTRWTSQAYARRLSCASSLETITDRKTAILKQQKRLLEQVLEA